MNRTSLCIGLAVCLGFASALSAGCSDTGTTTGPSQGQGDDASMDATGDVTTPIDGQQGDGSQVQESGGGDSAGQDVSVDAPAEDAGTDSPADVSSSDSPVDAPEDSPKDSPADSPVDAPVDAPPDSPVDSPADSPPDSSTESPCHDEGGVVGTGTAANPPNSATGTCPTGQTNTTGLQDSAHNYCCTQLPCYNGTTKVGTGTEASSSGTCPAESYDNLKDLAGHSCCGPLIPCTTAGQTGCVPCDQNTSEVCTPTEAKFVQLDIDLGLATTAAPETDPSSCYECLVSFSCIDDASGDVNKECEDNTGAATYASGTTVAECQSVLSCIVDSLGTPPVEAHGCAANGVSGCYCGTDPASSCGSGSASAPITAGVNGACASQIATGLNFPLGDGADISHDLSVKTLATGRAIQIFACANSNGCLSCL
jgi:hypothetical protein